MGWLEHLLRIAYMLYQLKGDCFRPAFLQSAVVDRVLPSRYPLRAHATA